MLTSGVFSTFGTFAPAHKDFCRVFVYFRSAMRKVENICFAIHLLCDVLVFRGFAFSPPPPPRRRRKARQIATLLNLRATSRASPGEVRHGTNHPLYLPFTTTWITDYLSYTHVDFTTDMIY